MDSSNNNTTASSPTIDQNDVETSDAAIVEEEDGQLFCGNQRCCSCDTMQNFWAGICVRCSHEDCTSCGPQSGDVQDPTVVVWQCCECSTENVNDGGECSDEECEHVKCKMGCYDWTSFYRRNPREVDVYSEPAETRGLDPMDREDVTWRCCNCEGLNIEIGIDEHCDTLFCKHERCCDCMEENI